MSQRRDGWTAVRVMRFLELLADFGSVQKAAQTVGMTASTAYRLRTRNKDFAQAWDTASDISMRSLLDSAMERAIHGTINPVFHKGEKVGERVTHDSRLMIFLMRMRTQMQQAETAVIAARGQQGEPGALLDKMMADLRKKMEDEESSIAP